MVYLSSGDQVSGQHDVTFLYFPQGIQVVRQLVKQGVNTVSISNNRASLHLW